jgi:hypothetical protein
MDTGDVNNQPAIRLWFPSGQKPRKSDFTEGKMVCEFWTLWQAVDDVGDAIEAGNKPNSCTAWIQCGNFILEESTILMRYHGSIGRPRDHKPQA